ncbi:MAG: methylenetetrahydrofolate--tRNA-(uracil(54)-C(5))-methyltransferase (FADH(2)-oxidizing) TrmFO [Chitinispirillales bacterium]|nr:methylenetetrahydrofolate--tRNA-(uracil(54)-C(5))-methyltransferase (FADH(2)-oxidizing) TrmFO [Chitinispirillales bacterium]
MAACSNSAGAAVIGAGLAGSEAAFTLASLGVPVTLYEARPAWSSPAHITTHPAELVCSNSFKARDLPSAHGLLKAELKVLGCFLLDIAHKTAVPAGAALAVDRELFSLNVLDNLQANPLIKLVREEITAPPADHDVCIIAAGPLASEKLTGWLTNEFLSANLHFYDAIAPIIETESIDMSIAFHASRREEGPGDYINCPFSEDEYRVFYEALREADRTIARSFEDAAFFESCLPVEVMAERGYNCLAFGPMRPIGLTDPRTGKRPFAVCQLRKETAAAESYNIVGFQTRLTIPEQQKVFRLIPGLQNAKFLRFGSIHRNTYLDSPKLLNGDLSFKKYPHIFLAGQICGNEGYTESVATGHLAALFAASKLGVKTATPPPGQTALGALLKHVTSSYAEPFCPTNIHFGLFPSLDKTEFNRKQGKKRKKEVLCERALRLINEWMVK